MAALCSYEAVGEVYTEVVREADGEVLRRRHVNLTWAHHSSQHCYINMGTTGAGAHQLLLRSLTSKQVRLYGIYWQPIGKGSTLLGR